MLKKISTHDFKNINPSHVAQPHFDHSVFRKCTITDAGKKSHQGQVRLVRNKTHVTSKIETEMNNQIGRSFMQPRQESPNKWS